MRWSEPIGAHVLPPLEAPAGLEGDVDGEGRWSPPRWTGGVPAARPAPPDAHEAAFARGVLAGRAEGERRVEQDLGPVLAALQRAAERIEHAEIVFERDRAQLVIVLALAVARYLFQREVEHDPELVTGLAMRAVDLIPNEAPIEVRLHPADLDVMRAAGGVPSRPDSGVRVDWVADPGLSRGDCVVESAARLVDGRLDVVLRQLSERLSHE